MSDLASIVEAIECVSRAYEAFDKVKMPTVPPTCFQDAECILSSVTAVSKSLGLLRKESPPVDTLKAEELEKGIYEIVSALHHRYVFLTSLKFESSTLKLIGRHRDENLHSDFIAKMLSTSAVGNFAEAFLARLVNDSSIKGYQFADREVRLEQLDQRLLGTARGSRRIDVLVKAQGIVLVIENKIDSQELENQTLDYGNVVRRRYGRNRRVYFLLLSPSGMSARCSDYKSLDYRDLYEILVSTLRNVPVSLDTKHLVESYLRCLTATFFEPEIKDLQSSIEQLKGKGYEFR